MAESTIEWLDGGKAWNPVTGCSKVSSGCQSCYAEVMSKRLAAMARSDVANGKNPGKKANYLDVIDSKGHWNGEVRCHESVLPDPLGWRKPSRVFVNSMSDLFHKGVPVEFIDKVFKVMGMCPHLEFIILTKRVERMFKYLDQPYAPCAIRDVEIKSLGRDIEKSTRWPFRNVILGTSVEDQKTADERLPFLCKLGNTGWRTIVSAEPLLAPIDFTKIKWAEIKGMPHGLTGHSLANVLKRSRPEQRINETVLCPASVPIGGVIVGGESGPGARPMHPDWPRSIRDKCAAAGVPFFFKQNGIWIECSDDDPHDHRRQLWVRRDGTIRSFGEHENDGDVRMKRVTKKKAGRLFDAVEHNGWLPGGRKT